MWYPSLPPPTHTHTQISRQRKTYMNSCNPQVRLLYERVPLHRKPFVQVIVSESLQFMEIYYFHNGQ